MLDYFYPQTVETVKSKYSGTIKVTKSRGKYSVWVGGYQQSGSLVEKIWRGALVKIKDRRIKTVLVLGLGCGSVIKPLRDFWPAAQITGVEIDPVMIALGKKYFDLGDYKNLKIVLSDTSRQKITHHDLVLVDTYVGGKRSGLNKIKERYPKAVILQNRLVGTRNFVEG